MRQVTIDLPEDVYLHIELRAAIDDQRISEGIETLLTEITRASVEKRPVTIVRTIFKA